MKFKKGLGVLQNRSRFVVLSYCIPVLCDIPIWKLNPSLVTLFSFWKWSGIRIMAQTKNPSITMVGKPKNPWQIWAYFMYFSMDHMLVESVHHEFLTFPPILYIWSLPTYFMQFNSVVIWSTFQLKETSSAVWIGVMVIGFHDELKTWYVSGMSSLSIMGVPLPSMMLNATKILCNNGPCAP